MCSGERVDERFTPSKCRELLRLLIECQLRGLDLKLADRIDRALEPWAVPDGTPGAI